MNKVILIGRLTADPELSFTSNGKGYSLFTVAVDRDYKRDDGERETDFVYCQAWGKIAENMAKYLSKGRQVAVEGKLRIDKVDQGAGKQAKYITKVVCDHVEFLSGGGGKSEKKDEGAVKNAAGEVVGHEVEFTDEDLPFGMF